MGFEKIQAAGAAAGRAKRLGQPWKPLPAQFGPYEKSPTTRKVAGYWWHGFTLGLHDCTFEELLARNAARDAEIALHEAELDAETPGLW